VLRLVSFVLFVGVCIAGWLWFTGQLTRDVHIDDQKLADSVEIAPYTKANALFSALRYQDAYTAYQEALAKNPGSNQARNARYCMAKCLDEMGHKSEAIEAYKNFMSQYSDDDRMPEAKKRMEWLSAGM
jgi:TolA-binding protein